MRLHSQICMIFIGYLSNRIGIVVDCVFGSSTTYDSSTANPKFNLTRV